MKSRKELGVGQNLQGHHYWKFLKVNYSYDREQQQQQIDTQGIQREEGMKQDIESKVEVYKSKFCDKLYRKLSICVEPQQNIHRNS